jgi:hypothetical protein
VDVLPIEWRDEGGLHAAKQLMGDIIGAVLDLLELLGGGGDQAVGFRQAGERLACLTDGLAEFSEQLEVHFVLRDDLPQKHGTSHIGSKARLVYSYFDARFASCSIQDTPSVIHGAGSSPLR